MSLNDDLLRSFKDQKEMIYHQIELFDPLGTKLRQPAAQRLVSKTAMIFTEVLCYLLSLGSIAGAFFINMVFPFYLLDNLHLKTELTQPDRQNIQYFTFGVYGAIGLFAILLLIIARCMRQIRLKNDILHFAGKQMKELVGQHLKSKAAIEVIEQRHFTELPPLPYEMNVNTIPNPGYGD
jgi:hypothetical protein